MLEVLLVVAFATVFIYMWMHLKKAYSFWEERGVPHPKPLPFIGNSWSSISRIETLNNFHKRLYFSFPDVPYYGIYDFTKPVLILRDTDLVERVLIKDFQHFVDRGIFKEDEQMSPLDINLSNMSGKKWKAMRNKFSPLFTTGKLRNMVPQMKTITDRVIDRVNKNPKEVNLRDMFQRFAMDVIGSIAFGINVNIVEEQEESEFRKMGKKSAQFNFKQYLRLLMFTIFPKIARILKLTPNDPAVTRYFTTIIKETLAYRRETGVTRNDFIQLFLTLQQKGHIDFEGDQDDEYLRSGADIKNEKKMESLELTDEVMTGQAFVFLIAGFDATSVMMMYLCYELALNPEIQKKVRQEILIAVKNRGGVLDYDTLKDMQYFGQCVQEVTRLHTFVGFLFRTCTKDYTFPGTSLSIKAGQQVIIPTIGIHNDPAVFEEPEKFNPDRFGPDASNKNCSYLAFGEGPRVCIAMRFALAEIKLGVARMLQDYIISLSPRTKLPLVMEHTNFNELPKYPIYFDLTKAENVMQ